MVSDIRKKEREREKEIKNLWIQHQDKKLSDFYQDYLGNYFNVENWKVTDNDWLSFMGLVRKWKREQRANEVDQEVKELTDEGAEKMQNENRRRMILVMHKVLKEYEANPRKMKNVSLAEVRKMYKAVQSLEEAIKRTKIAKGKLGLEAARTFLLPYQRLSAEDLLKLKESFNESINRILEARAEKAVLVGPSDVSSG